jgi:heat shock protein HslJ
MRALLVALALLGACAAPAPSSTDPGQIIVHLSGTKWRRVDDTNANPHGATLDFDGNRASGYTGCNNWTATVTQNGEELRFSNVSATERACDGAGVQIDTERNFLAALEATRYAHYDQDALFLLDAQQHAVAEFRSEL